MWTITRLGGHVAGKEVWIAFDAAEEAMAVFQVLERYNYRGYFLREPGGTVVRNT